MEPIEVLDLMDKLGRCSVSTLERLHRRLNTVVNATTDDKDHNLAVRRLRTHVADELNDRRRDTDKRPA